jgi:hypothetical protein
MYTSKGNVLLSSLVRHPSWESISDGQGLRFREIYTLNGEIVKDGSDNLLFPTGTQITLGQGTLNG